MKPTLYRYLIRELIPSFFLGLAGFTFVLFTGRILQLTELLVNKGISFTPILLLLYYLLPSFLMLTIPMATLLAVLLTFNRLSGDNEITALKASGVSLYQLVPPVLAFACVAYAATLFFSLYALPRANQASRDLLYQMASTKAHAGVEERVFNDDFEGLVLYVERVEPKTFRWEKVFISDARNAADVHTIVAREGEVLSDPERLTVHLRLKNGSIHRLGDKPEAYQKIDFDTYNLRLDLRTGMPKPHEKHPADMSLKELSRAIRSLEAQHLNVKFHWIKIHEKFSIPLACIIFGILGIPLGVQSRPGRTGRSMGFAWSIVMILLYYLLTNAGTSLAERGTMLLEAAMWGPNFLFSSLGAYLLVKAANESPVLPLVWLNNGMERLRRGSVGAGAGRRAEE